MKKLIALVVGLAAGVAGAYDSSSYVQHGLIAQWDGIDNTGTGTHNSLARVWKDLAGQYDLTLTANGTWTGGTALFCNGCAASYGAVGPTAYQTIEIVYRQTEKQSKSAGIVFCSGHNYRMGLSKQDGTSFFFRGTNDKHIYWDSMDGEIRSVAAVYKDTSTACALSNVFVKGEVVADAKSANESWNAGDGKLMVGDRAKAAAYPFKGEICAIRLYSRGLTDEELAANYKVDSVRYLGATPDDVLTVCGAPYDVPVAISPSYAGQDGLANGDTLTLAAPTDEVTLPGGQKAVCTGYKVYDASGNVVDSGSARSYSYTHPGEFRRFEWQFDLLCPVSVSGEGGEYSITAAWVTHGQDFTFTITPNEGKFVKTVSNDFDDETWAKTVVTKRILGPTAFTVTYAQAYYVSPEGDDAKDGKTHANAKQTIASALACAVVGDAVVLMAGEHAQPSATVTLDKAVSVCGEEGAEKTFVKLTADVAVFSLKAAGAAVRGLTFRSDYATKVGCPISITAAALAEDCVIRDAYIVHSPVYAKNGGIVRNVHIEHVKGDGRYETGFEIDSAATLVENCSAIACEGNNDTYGCAAYIWNGTMRNCLFACNTNKSTQTGGAYVKGVGVLENCTIVDNVCLGSGTRAGVVEEGTSASVRNCLVSGNMNQAGELNWSGDETRYTYTCTAPVPSGTGNVLATSPDFTDRANKNYALKSGNAIDAGTGSGWQATSLDLAGNARVIGSSVDMGCYETVPGVLAASAVPDQPNRVGEGRVTLQAHVSGADLAGVAYVWTVTDDAGEQVVVDTTSGATFAYDYDYGRYTVRLDVRNAVGETATWTAPKAFSVIPTTVYVATDSTPKYPFATKSTAANDLATALTAAIDGSTVVICDGTYDVAANVAITKDVIIRSENGADRTVLRTDDAIRVFSISSPGARIENLTLTSDGRSRNCSALGISSGTVSGCVVSNFYSNGSQVVSLAGLDAVLTNCLVKGNRTSGRINTVQISSPGGIVTHSRVVGNVNDNNAYGAAVQLYGGVCTVRNSLIASNTNLSNQASAFGSYANPSAGSLVENCTVVGNHVAGSSANAACRINANVKVRNCVIVDNTNTGGEANWDTTGANISYTCTTPVPTGSVGSFEPSGVLFADGDFRIRSGILTDVGLNQPWMTGGLDLDGNARLYDGGTVDLGCYEYVPGALECSAVPSTVMRIGAGEVVLTALTSVTGDDMVYTWCVSNQLGEVVAEVSGRDRACFTNDYVLGEYSVELRVEKGGQVAEFAQDALFTVKPAAIYVTTTSTPAYPYDTKANAFNQIDEALGFAESGMTVIVTDGVYTNATNPTISKDVTLVSENGADRAVVYGTNGTTAWTLNSSGATVRGFTLVGDREKISSANQQSRQAHAVSVLQGTLTDCVLTNWFAYYVEVLTVGGGVAAGVVTNCLVTGNESHYRTHFLALSKNALMTHCRVVGNVCDTASRDYSSIFATYGDCVLRSTLVAENTSIRTTGDAVYASVIDVRTTESTLVESCTIVSNRSTSATSPAIWCESNGDYNQGYSSKLVVRNCIVWGNENSSGVLDWKDISACFTKCCCSTPGLGADNISEDPKLRLRSSKSHPIFSLSAGSPCIDAAETQSWMVGAADLAGNPRIVGEAPDIGCYERQPDPGLMILVR